MKRIALFLSIGAVVMLLASGAMAKGVKQDVCHYPPGNGDNPHTINVSENAVDTHLDHGDTLGECPDLTGLCEPCQSAADCDPAAPGASGNGLGCYPCACELADPDLPPLGVPVIGSDCASFDCPPDAPPALCSDNQFFLNCDGLAY